jgi:hypothetical protein
VKKKYKCWSCGETDTFEAEGREQYIGLMESVQSPGQPEEPVVYIVQCRRCGEENHVPVPKGKP